MRGECLLRNFPSAEFTVIDTAVPLQGTSRLWRSIGWRFQVGPMISGLNEYIRRRLPAKTQELIWVDKAVFLTPELTRLLRDRAKLLVHYTPDMAFCANRSALFYRSAHYYDYLITTKTCEANDYRRLVDAGKTQIIMTTQGFRLSFIGRSFRLSGKRGSCSSDCMSRRGSRFSIACLPAVCRFFWRESAGSRSSAGIGCRIWIIVGERFSVIRM